MDSSPTAERLAETLGASRFAYLASHRALAACTRELGRLSDEVVRRVAKLEAAHDEKPVVRQSPDRTIIQLGPVALTLAWLRRTLDSAADGQLLVIVWNGIVAPPGDHRFERVPLRAAMRPAAKPATVVWEESYIATGDSEAAWIWRPMGVDLGGYSSADLATRCVERLHLAHDATLSQGAR